MKKSKVLFILHLPDPVHGASMVGKYIKESKIINNAFDADYINLATSTTLYESGKAGSGKVTKFLKIQLKVLKALASKKYDLCYVTITAKAPAFYKDVFVISILKLFGKKIIYHFHNKGVSTRQDKRLDNLLYKFSFTNAKIILLSEFLYNDIKKYVKKENVFFCPNGIPKIPASLIQQKTANNNLFCRLLFLSNMMAEKGVYVLLDACKLLKEKGIDFECHFVGAWFDVTEEDFNKRVQTADLSGHVFAHGKKYGDEKLTFFNNTDIFIFPTYYHNETFGLVIVEAMQFALPIIATPEGGIPDVVVDGETGFLVPQHNATKLSLKIEQLIKNPELRYKMGVAGEKRFFDLFTIDKFEIRLAEILNEAIRI